MACGFHAHTDQGSLDGGSTVESRIKRTIALGRIADCVTDHGTMSALSAHWLAAKKDNKNPIMSIHGIELYVIDEQRPPKEYKNGKKEPRYYHLTIHFKDIQAYEYFCKMTPIMESRALVRYGERKPLIYLRELEPISGHITIGSGCLVGPVQGNILGNRADVELGINQETRLVWAKQNYEYLRTIAGPGNFFVEVFPHLIEKDWSSPIYKGKILTQPGFFKTILEKNHVCGAHCCGVEHVADECGHMTIPVDIQKASNLFVVSMAKTYGDPIVISEDSHIASPEDKIAHDVRLGNGKERWKFYNNYCMRDSNEWAVNLQQQLGVAERDVEEWIDNSYRFVDLFKEYKMLTSKDRILLPTIEMVYNETKDTKLKLAELIEKHGRMPSPDHPQYKVYKDRLDYEVSVLTDNGTADFLPYFFVIEDCANFARANSILMNTRGSGGGSLVAYLLRICVTDPIKYGLPFERFLTLGRIKSGSLPDLDTDWEDRALIIDYVLQKYGPMAALISTNMLLRVKSSIKDVERFRNGSVDQNIHILLKMVKGAPQGTSDKDWLFGFTDKTTGEHKPGFLEEKSKLADEFRNYIETATWTDEDGVDHLIWDDVLKCLAVTRTKGVHAGGVIITPKPVHDYMPLLVPKEEGILASAYTMKGVEDVGGVKYDFLGVKTLKSISITLKSIKERTGLEIEWGEFPHDPNVYKDIINSGLLAALFQINTPTMAPYVARIKPKSILDVANICALVRPGALDAPSPDPKDPPTITAAYYYVSCANGERSPYYIHESLKPILQDTFGVLLNQEQALQIFRDVGDYTFEEAEMARRGIGKKDKEVLTKELNRLKAKCLEKGWTEAQSQRLFDTIVASARYSFNKAHSVSYAIVCYNGAWLKKHYPVDFWKGELEVRLDDQDKLREYLRECAKYVLGVSVLSSSPTEWKIEDVDGIMKLRPPLASMKGCGQKSVENLRSFLEATSPSQLFVHDVDADKEEPEKEEEAHNDDDDVD